MMPISQLQMGVSNCAARFQPLSICSLSKAW